MSRYILSAIIILSFAMPAYALVAHYSYINRDINECRKITVAGPTRPLGKFAMEKYVVPSGWERIENKEESRDCKWTGELDYKRRGTFIANIFIVSIVLAGIIILSLPVILLIKLIKRFKK